MSKQKPPNAFSWFTRYVADQRCQSGRPFRSIKAAINQAAIQWEKLDQLEKNEWKGKARMERLRFRSDPELRTMTVYEFIGQACDISPSGMNANSNFWSRHWTKADREQHAEELQLVEQFDTKKRQEDRQAMETYWNWTFSGTDKEFGEEMFLLFSVQSSSPVDAENFKPETIAMAQFTVKKGILPYSEFCCSLAGEEEWNASRREHDVGDDDGCQARIGMQAVAKLIFQRVNLDTPNTRAPMFFCLAEEFEMVYDALCQLKMRYSNSSPDDGRPQRLSVKSVGTMEDLTQCIFKRLDIPLPTVVGQLQDQLYFDTMMERVNPGIVAVLRCGDHERDSLTRCPMSVIRLTAIKIKDWIERRGIPKDDLPLIERQMARQDWPIFPDVVCGTENGAQDSDDEDGRRKPNSPAVANGVLIDGKMERTLAWVRDQDKIHTEDEQQSSVMPRGLPITSEGKYEEKKTAATREKTEIGEKIGIGKFDGEPGKPGYIPFDMTGLGEELVIQQRLPFGTRGIGRGIHLIPSYVTEFQALKVFLNQ